MIYFMREAAPKVILFLTLDVRGRVGNEIVSDKFMTFRLPSPNPFRQGRGNVTGQTDRENNLRMYK